VASIKGAQGLLGAARRLADELGVRFRAIVIGCRRRCLYFPELAAIANSVVVADVAGT